MTMPARRWFSVFLMVALLGVLGSTSVQGAALFEEGFMNNSGYIRQYVSMNVQDIPETLDDDQYALNMVRTQFLLESDLEVADWANLHSRLRAAQEYETEYLENLQTASNTDDELTAISSGTAGTVERNGAISPITDYYESGANKEDLDIRELYLDLNLTRNTRIRAGKQLVSWGKGSLQRALDLTQGFDNTWAPFITDEEERRKGTIMALFDAEVPGWGGSIQAYYQPGYDDAEDIGNTDPTFGGRYTANGLRGVNVHEPVEITGAPVPLELPLLAPRNPDHSHADVEGEKFGVRFRGLAFNNSVEYSLAYLRTHQKSSAHHHVVDTYRSDTIPMSDPACPAVVPITAAGGEDLTDDIYDGITTGGSDGNAPCLESGNRRESIHPLLNVYGGSANYYSPTLDLVIRGEVALLKDRVFNQPNQEVFTFVENTALALGASPSDAEDLASTVADQFSNPVEKDQYRLMLGFDRTAYFVTWLGADRPGLLTVEFFDFLIDDFEDSEDLKNTLHSQGLKEHSIEAVLNLDWSYANGYYTMGVQAPVDMSYGGNWTAIPSFGVNPTTNWRILVKGVFVFEDTPGDELAQGTFGTRYGFNGDADRITTQVTYQF